MRFLTKILVFVLFIVLLAVGLFFAIYNTQKVALDFVFFSTPEFSIGIWLVVALAVGGVIGFLINSMALVTLKTRLNRSRKKIELADKELTKLRTATVKDAS